MTLCGTSSAGNVLAQISTGLVQLHSRHYGKGPTKAKTHVLDELVVCVLRDGFTTVERTLLEAGDGESVHQMRRSFQLVMEGEFRHVVEEATGRKVVAYMSTIHTDPDLAVELFVLEPVSDELPFGGVSRWGWRAAPGFSSMSDRLALEVGPGAVAVAKGLSEINGLLTGLSAEARASVRLIVSDLVESAAKLDRQRSVSLTLTRDGSTVRGQIEVDTRRWEAPPAVAQVGKRQVRCAPLRRLRLPLGDRGGKPSLV